MKLIFNSIRVFLLCNKLITSANFSLAKAKKLRNILQNNGPIFIKLGQALSIRPDLLGHKLCQELALLQDRVFTKASLPKELKQLIDANIICDFQNTPIASASIADVYQGTIANKKIAIKVIKPKIKEQILGQIKQLHFWIKVFSFFAPALKKLKLPEFLQEFTYNISNELDLKRELFNAEKLASQKVPHLQLPKLYPQYSTSKILVLEWVNGNHLDLVKQQNVIIKRELATKGISIFLHQVFKFGFFHGDMHPGNIMINLDYTKYVAVDFGICGYLGLQDRYFLIMVFYYLTTGNFYQLAKIHRDFKVIDSKSNLTNMALDLEFVCKPLLTSGFNAYKLSDVFLAMVGIMQRYNYKPQPSLLLFHKTLLAVEGLGRELDPGLKFWLIAKPIIKQMYTDIHLQIAKSLDPINSLIAHHFKHQ